MNLELLNILNSTPSISNICILLNNDRRYEFDKWSSIERFNPRNKFKLTKYYDNKTTIIIKAYDGSMYRPPEMTLYINNRKYSEDKFTITYSIDNSIKISDVWTFKGVFNWHEGYGGYIHVNRVNNHYMDQFKYTIDGNFQLETIELDEDFNAYLNAFNDDVMMKIPIGTQDIDRSSHSILVNKMKSNLVSIKIEFHQGNYESTMNKYLNGLK